MRRGNRAVVLAFAALALVLAVLLVAGCGGNGEDAAVPEEQTTVVAEEPAPEPEPTPAPVEEPEPGLTEDSLAPPPGEPDLSTFAFTRDDLPAGDYLVMKDGYIDRERSVATYLRGYMAESVEGGVWFTMIDLSETEAQAAEVCAGMKEWCESPENVEEVFNQLSASVLPLGEEFKLIGAETLTIENLGDLATGIQGHLRGGPGEEVRAEQYMLFFQVGRTMNMMFWLGPEGEVELDDVVAVARTQAERIESGLSLSA